MKFQIPTFFSGTVDRSSLRQSRSFGSGLSVSGAGSGSLGRHPPLPPKPRLEVAETDSDQSRHRAASLAVTPGAAASLHKTSPSEQELVRELLFVFQVLEKRSLGSSLLLRLIAGN